MTLQDDHSPLHVWVVYLPLPPAKKKQPNKQKPKTGTAVTEMVDV